MTTLIADITVLSENTDMVEKLLACGAISDTEGKLLLEQFRDEHQADRDTCARRVRFAPTTTTHNFGEETMNPNDTIAQIELTHAVMSAQLRKLNEISPAPRSMPQVPIDGSNGLADLLYTTVAGHVESAAKSLHAIAEVEQSVRAVISKSVEAAPTTSHNNPQVIDGEFKEVVS